MKKTILALAVLLILCGCQPKEKEDPLRPYAIQKAVEYYLDFEEYDSSKEYTIHKERNYKKDSYPVNYQFCVNGISRFSVSVDFHQQLEKPTIKYGDGYLTVEVNKTYDKTEYSKNGYVINDMLNYSYVKEVMVEEVKITENQQQIIDKKASDIIKSYVETTYPDESVVYYNCLKHYETSLSGENFETVKVEQLLYVDYPIRVNGKMVAYVRIDLSDLNKLGWTYVETTDYEVQRMINQGMYFVDLNGAYISDDVKLPEPLSHRKYNLMAQDALLEKMKTEVMQSIRIK